MSMKELEEFLDERHDLKENTKVHYRMAFQALAKYCEDPFRLTRKEMNRALSGLKEDYAAASWNSYVACICVWYKWRYGDGEVLPDAVRHVKMQRVSREDYVRTKILSQDEINGMIRACSHPRDRAILAVLAATGVRRGELLGMRVGDVEAKPYGYRIRVDGKTGRHTTPTIVKGYAKLLRVWLEHHPDRDNKQACLWCHTKDGFWGSLLKGIGRTALNNVVKHAAEAAGLQRNVHPHMFRHTENTLATAKGVSRAARNKMHGWSDGGNTAAVYEHLTDGDAEQEYLQAFGIVAAEDREIGLAVQTCVYCGFENAGTAKYCHECGTVLDAEEAELQIREDRAKQRFHEVMGSPEVLRWLKKRLEKDGIHLEALEQLTEMESEGGEEE